MKLNGEQQVHKTSRDNSIKHSEFEPGRSKRDKKKNKPWRWFIHLPNR